MRTPYWWEKFDWFVSSENLLVLCAKDPQQAEMLVRRHLRARDTFVHADLPNAPVCIVKHNGGSADNPPLTSRRPGAPFSAVRMDGRAGWSRRRGGRIPTAR